MTRVGRPARIVHAHPHGHAGTQGHAQLVYATGIIGGYIADHVLGYQRSILLGAIIMAAGMPLPETSPTQIHNLSRSTKK